MEMEILKSLRKALRTRNELIFKKRSSSPEETMLKAICIAKEWFAERVQSPTTQQETMPERPEGNFLIIQIDAAWRRDWNLAGLAWTIQKEERLVSFASHCFYVASPLIGEALAMREALIMCEAEGFQRMHIKSDSKQLIQAITGDNVPPEIYGLVADITSLCSLVEEVHFSWIPRSKNKPADDAAKQALHFASSVMNPIVGP